MLGDGGLGGWRWGGGSGQRNEATQRNTLTQRNANNIHFATQVSGLDIVREPEHLHYNSEWDKYVIPDYPDDQNPDVTFDCIRNVSVWSQDTDPQLGKDEVGNERDMPWYTNAERTFQGYIGDDDDTGGPKFTFAVESDKDLQVADFTFSSTNEHLLPSDDGGIKLTKKDEEQTSGKQEFELELLPVDLACGSTTIDVIHTDSETDAVSRMDFTLTTYSMPFCPYMASFFGLFKLSSVSFSLFVISGSVIIQVFLFMSLSSLGDFGPNRKIILLQSGIAGSICLSLLYTCDEPGDYMKAGGFVMACNALFGLSIVMYNAYLPYLTKSHPTFQAKMAEFKANKSGGPKAIGGALKDLLAAYGDLQDQISTKGYFWGYIGGILALIVTLILVMVVFSDDGRLALRVSILFTGLWWFVFTLPMIPFLETRPGPPLPNLGLSYKLTFSLRRQYASMLTLKHIPETRRFLIG